MKGIFIKVLIGMLVVVFLGSGINSVMSGNDYVNADSGVKTVNIGGEKMVIKDEAYKVSSVESDEVSNFILDKISKVFSWMLEGFINIVKTGEVEFGDLDL